MRAEVDADLRWVSELSGTDLEPAREALREAEEETALFDHLSREHAREGRESYIEIDAPLELHALVRLIRPVHVVEVGVSSGVSSAYLLNALEKNRRGTLHSVDLPSTARRRKGQGAPRFSWSIPPGRSSGWAVPRRLHRRWDLRLGDKRTVLPTLSEELPRIDLFVYDVPHKETDARREFRAIDRIFAPGAVAIVDHGPGGGLCRALAGWTRDRGSRAHRRRGLGLYGMRSKTSPPLAGS